MHERYENTAIKNIWLDSQKLNRWQMVELAVIRARENLKEIPAGTHAKIMKDLEKNPIDLDWWKNRDNKIHHDLNAFLDERRRFIAPELQRYFHQGITSYDTEEPAFAAALKLSCAVVNELAEVLLQTLRRKAETCRYLPMMARTHGQEAQLQSFGKRCLCWYAELNIAVRELKKAQQNLCYSKLSGAVGNYDGINSAIEQDALALLSFEPFYGATQIIPRVIYQPLANALCALVCVCNSIALDIRLGARSGRPLYHEPFSKDQMASSAMPHKKNTILTEQMEGMESMAKGYLLMITDRIKTWEERAIEQSCVERVAWPDLFHVAVRCLSVMHKVLSGLVIYPDNMMLEIVESCGCYASNAAKEFLKERAMAAGFTTEEVYRIVQLASFNALMPNDCAQNIRDTWQTFENYAQAEKCVNQLSQTDWRKNISIKDIICDGQLKCSPELAASATDVQRWNNALQTIFFGQNETQAEWENLFTIQYHLRQEISLFSNTLYETN